MEASGLPPCPPDPSSRGEVVLIGPCGSGKSTIGGLLAKNLRIPSISMDDLCQGYYAEAPENPEPEAEAAMDTRFPHRWRQGRWKDLFALQRLLSEHRDCVFDLGAGHSVYDNPTFYRRAQHILQPFANVVLLVPSPDPAESIRVLRERTLRLKGWDCTYDGFDFHAHFVLHADNRGLAKFVVYTESRSPDETCAEILATLQLTPPPPPGLHLNAPPSSVDRPIRVPWVPVPPPTQ